MNLYIDERLPETEKVGVSQTLVACAAAGICIFSYIAFYFHSVVNISGLSQTLFCLIELALIVLAIFTVRKGGMRLQALDLCWLYMLLLVYRGTGLAEVGLYLVAVLALIMLRSCGVRSLRPLYVVIMLFTAYYTFGVLLAWLLPGIYERTFFRLFQPEYQALIRRWDRPSGFAYQVGQTAGFLVVGLGALCFLSKKKKKGRNALAVAIVLLCILLSGKRAHLLFSVIAACFVYYTKQQKASKKLFTFFVLCYCAIAGWFGLLLVNALFPEISGVSRIIETFNGLLLGEDVSNGRSGYYAIAIMLIRQSPWLGIGWGQYRLSDAQVLYENMQNAHNCYLQLLCETGVIGTIVILLPCLIILIKTIRLQRDVRECGCGERFRWCQFSLFYQVFTLLYFLTGNPLYDAQYFLMYFLSIGIYFCVSNRAKSDRDGSIAAGALHGLNEAAK